VPFDHTSDLILNFKEGAFDEVVKGVDAIEHTASPFHFNPKEPEGANKDFTMMQYSFMYFYDVELINPAVQGTLGMLKSALKNGYVHRYLNICAIIFDCC
jgi:hypothetical protein